MRRTAVVCVAVLLLAGWGGQAGREIDVSRLRLDQAETTVAADPGHPEILIAGSNSESGTASYTSIDSGRTWRAANVPPPYGFTAAGDPAVAVDDRGREAFAFLAYSPLVFGTQARLVVATRGRGGVWRRARFARPGEGGDDKPTIAADVDAASPHRSRLYLAWTLQVKQTPDRAVVSHSDDGGASWSRPVAVGGPDSDFASVGVGVGGAVYVAWYEDDALFAARSADGGDRFGRAVEVDRRLIHRTGACTDGLVTIPAQPVRCVSPIPALAVDHAGRMVVVYAVKEPNRGEEVYATSFGPDLQLRHRRVAVHPGPQSSDRFDPAVAADPVGGRLWACFYDTAGLHRTQTRFTCAVSVDGGATWPQIIPAASVPSDLSRSNFSYGEYAGVVVAGGVAHPVWTDGRRLRTLGAEVYTAALTARQS